MNIEPKEPYVYQPFGIGENKGKIYGVGGIPGRLSLRGLDKQSATEIVRVMKDNPEFAVSFSDGIRKKLKL